uniref:Macro domain-containing protein n=1 Tax=Capra hircus TaxID=9925 RepID=A0A8C2XWS2_CAPHI
MFLQSRASRLLAQLRAAGQLLGAPRPWPGPSPGATRTRSTACGPLASLSAHHPCARTSAGVGAWGAAAVGRRAGVRAWAPLAMAAKVDLSTSTDWKEAKSFLKGLSDKQREEHYFCRDFIRLKKIPTWKETAKGVTVTVEEPKYKKDKQLNEKISLFRGDITKLEVDAIVNAGLSSGGLTSEKDQGLLHTFSTSQTPGQQLPARRWRRGRLHPPSRRTPAHRRVPDPAELRDRQGQDHLWLSAAGQVCHPHGGTHRPRRAERQPGCRAPQLLPEQPRPAAGAPAPLGGVPLHLHWSVRLPQRGGGRGSADRFARVAGAAQGQGGPADHLRVPGEGREHLPRTPPPLLPGRLPWACRTTLPALSLQSLQWGLAGPPYSFPTPPAPSGA